MRRSTVTAAGTAAMRGYALQQTRTLLRRLAFQVNRTARAADADSIHDLRVAIRRFSQCLRVFAPFYPKAAGKKIRGRLRTIMKESGQVRNRDITIDLMKDAGIPKRAGAMELLRKERKQAEQELLGSIRRASRNNFSRKWREKLEL